MKVQKPRSCRLLELHLAKATSEERVSLYGDHLESSVGEHDMNKSPDCIYNLDAKGLTENHTPPSIVGSSQEAAFALTLPRSSTTTVIGCVIHPIFNYWMDVSMLHQELRVTGWSNSEIFKKYLSRHFIRYCIPSRLCMMITGHMSCCLRVSR